MASDFGGIRSAEYSHNKAAFGPLLKEVDHLRHTHDPGAQRLLARAAGRMARTLPTICCASSPPHGEEKIAAVIVEPMAGSTGVLPPPKGYLERLREICTEHEILLIFDEVITGFGRLGAPFAAQRFGVQAGHDRDGQGHDQRHDPDGRASPFGAMSMTR